MASPKHYTFHVPDANLEKLKRKLEDTDYPDELETDDQLRYGAPSSDVKRLAEHWRTGFDWRKAEAKINELPNYRKKMNVERFGDFEVHFVWQKSEVEGAIPLLFCHGWSGSFLEVKELPTLAERGRREPRFQEHEAKLHSTSAQHPISKQPSSDPLEVVTLIVTKSVNPAIVDFSISPSPTGIHVSQ